MWSPTHVQVTVQRARGLLLKGKSGTNDAFVTIGLGKEKYQTSVKEKAPDSVEWHEKCELQIPKQGNTAEIILTVLHRNFMGVDEFLGMVGIPLAEMDVYERPRNRWYKLKSKPGKEKNKERGELEVKVAFIVKSGSLADLSKKEKHKSSLGQLSTALGGSLISISSLDKRKGLKKLAGKIGSKIGGKHKSKEKVFPETGSLREVNKLSHGLGDSIKPSQQKAGDADPGVISEGESEDDFTLDDLSHKGSGYSLEIGDRERDNYSVATHSSPNSGSLENLAGGEFLRRSDTLPPAKPPRIINPPPEPVLDEWEQKLYGKYGKGMNVEPTSTLQRRMNAFNPLLSSTPAHGDPPPKLPPVATPSPGTPPIPPFTFGHLSNTIVASASVEELSTVSEDKPSQDFKKTSTLSIPSKTSSLKSSMERIIIGGETESVISHRNNSSKYSSEVLKKIDGKSREELIDMVMDLQQQKRDLEDYLDQLLLRVMETSPRILQNPYMNCKTQAKIT
ncbi:rab11 family-interacting protein 1 isoform X2 [Homalodisca vitripennis]|uniref:rab11 family-interacting protein 1 isoform X2 n=1 Tax=Homalodisca vitripennis TaxID=197043 RepID=UPI001EE9DD57|nr:rab11 family-interacting protein 1 isoform X2 [Homalodisca vitripennis]